MAKIIGNIGNIFDIDKVSQSMVKKQAIQQDLTANKNTSIRSHSVLCMFRWGKMRKMYMLTFFSNFLLWGV